MVTKEELLKQLAELQKENEYLKVLDELPEATGTDLWGNPRAPITDEDRKRFKAGNAKNGARKEASQENNNMLALVAKLHNAREANRKLRKKKK